MRLSIDELMHLAPRLRGYLKTPTPAWPEIVDAADWLRGELGVSKSLWGDACQAMGREQAAIAIAIVSSKPAEHFRSTPGGYFHGMVAKAKTGQLNRADNLGLAPDRYLETAQRLHPVAAVMTNRPAKWVPRRYLSVRSIGGIGYLNDPRARAGR